MLKNLKRAAAIVLSFVMAIQFGLANSYYVNAEEEPVEPQQEQTTTVENNNELQEEETNEVAAPETKSVELSYVAEDGTILQAATYRDFDLNYSLNADSSVMLNFDGYTLKDVIVNNSHAASADQVSLNVTSELASVQFVYKKVITETDHQTAEQPKTEEKNDDDAEADPDSKTEVKEELPEYPAFIQSETAGNVVVHATAAEGVLPRGSKLVVKRITRKSILNAVEETVSEKNKEVESAVALDITIQNKDGVEIQPNGLVNISFENVAVTGEEVNVYHVTNDANTVTEVATNTQSFDTNHYSIYVITGENQVPLTTFNFVVNGEIVSTQIVKSGNTLIAPTAPDAIGQAFVGWVDEAGNPFTGFGKQSEITETTTRTITARYEAALYVYFLNPDGSQIMRTEKVGDHEAHDFTTVSYDVDSTHKLVGWADEANGTKNIADKITVPNGSTSVNVYAIIKEGYWVSFNSDGGSIVDSQFVLHGDKLVLGKDTTPTKPGYTFDGWYNGLTEVHDGATVTSPMTLTAHWKAAEVNYTVIHWWENADDDEYAFHESQELQGLTGATTTAAAKSYTIKGKNIHGKDTSDKVFTATTIEQKTIKGDGSTIVNVYYKRKTYTMHFKERSYSRTDYTTITKKWGQSISKKEWPTYNGNGNWQISDSRYLAYTSTMPMNDSTLWSTSGRKTFTAYYYVRNIEDTGYELHHKDVIKSSSNYLTIGQEDCYAIAGFTYDHGDPGVGGSYNNSEFYYTRNSYKIKFINNGKEDKSVEKKYEQSISNENYTPARPSSLPDYYEFDGWYDNELCEGEKYVFNGKTMPAQNITLYAKWTAKKISLIYNLNNPEGTVDKGIKKVAAGTIASTVLPSASAIEGYSFAGWYVADGAGHMTTEVFNANDPILKDTNVIGKWLYNGKLTVKYVADGVEAPKDNNVYAGGAKATVANGVEKKGKKFLGWQLDDNVYQPGQNFEVNKDLADDKNVITLTAKFGDSETSAILNYHPGNGDGEDQSVAILNNVEVTLESTSNLHYSAPGEDYYFAGWATSMEDAKKGNAKYAVGDRVRVNADSSNDLYATWVKKTVINVTANSNTLQYNGKEQKVEGFKVVTAGYEVTGLKAEAKGTNFGTYDTVITGPATVTKGDVDVTDKVIVNVTKGKLTISKRDVTLTSGSASRVYNKEALTNKEVTVSGDGFAKDEGATYTVTGSQTEVGESDNTFTYTLKEGTLASNYNITKKEGKLSITPVTDEVTVRIKGKKDTVTYDGNPHSVEGYEITDISNKLYTKDDVKFTGEAKAEGTEAGTYQMNLSETQFSNKNSNFKKVTFVVEDGSLTINRKSIDDQNRITVTKPSDSKYDGEEHKNKPTVTDTKTDRTLVEGTDYELSYSKDVINAGTVTVTITGIGNYNGTVDTSYEITPKEYTVTTNTASKVYDGTALTASGKVEGIVSGETYNFTITGTQTDVGSSDNTYTFEWNGTAKKSNYKLAKESIGKLTVNKQSIVPDPDHPETYKEVKIDRPKDVTYDGKKHKWAPTVTDKDGNSLVVDQDYKVTYSTTDFTNVTGEIKVTITGIGNYTGSLTRKYRILRREYKVVTDSKSKVYDGDALTAGGKVEGIVKGETYGFTITGTQTEVDSSANTYDLKWTGSAKSSNYRHGKDSIGTLTVKAQSIVPDPEHPETYLGIEIDSPSDITYDGKEHKWSPVVSSKAKTALVAGKDYAVEYSTTDFTNVTGEITVTIRGINNYTGSLTRTYKILPREYTVTTESNSKVYDGTALTAGGKIEGIVKGETYSFTITGAQTDVGSSDNTYDLKWTGSAKESNYKHGKDSIGTLTVKAKSIVPDGPDTPEEKKTGITVSDPSDSKYDGKEHREVLTVKDTKTDKKLVADKDYSVTYSDDLVNAGTVTIKVAGLGNYTGSFEKTYKITKRSVTLTSANATKTYDGTALTNTSITVSGDGFVEGEGAEYKVTGTQTQVGNSANSFEYKLNENTLASNYDITKVVGTLTITAAPAPVIPAPTPRTPSVPQVITPVETVEKEETPKAEEPKTEKVEEEYTPKASPQYYWALINLICAIVTVLFGLLLLISKRHKDEDDKGDDETKQQTTTNEDEEKEQEKKRGLFTRVLAVLIAIASVVFFLVTEDMSLDWTWTDQWTIWMVVLGIVQIAVFFVGRKWKSVDNDDEDEEAQQA